MKSERNSTLFIVPPSGPMTWLFPDLKAIRPGGPYQGDAGTGAAATVLNLQSEGLSGRALLDRIEGAAPQRIRLEGGPCGYTLWTWLAQAFRETDAAIDAPALFSLASSLKDLESGAGKESISIETVLRNVAASLGGADTVVVEKTGSLKLNVETADLSLSTARSILSRRQQGHHLAWLLPLEPACGEPVEPNDGLETRLNECLQKIASDYSLFQDACLVPFFNTRPAGEESGSDTKSKGGSEDPSFSTRLLPSWWGLLPGDLWLQSIRALFLELMRALHPDKVFLFRAFENYALAGIDSYLEGVMGRFDKLTAGGFGRLDAGRLSAIGRTKDELTAGRTDASAPQVKESRGRPLILGICGTDGSGKSSHVAALKEYLEAKGLKVCVHKIYRHGVFHDTVTDVTRGCANGQNLHLWRIQRIVKAFDSIKYFYAVVEKDLAEHDVVIFDRYTFTHYAAGVGRYHHDPFARELLSVYPEADRIYLLDVPTEEAMRRIGTRDERTVDENTYMLMRYRHALLDLGDRFDFKVLNAMDPFEENRQSILDDVEELLSGHSIEGGTP